MKEEDGRRNEGGTHLAIHLVLLILPLLFDHEDRMIEEKDLELGAFTLRPTALLERTLVDDLALLISQSQILFPSRSSANDSSHSQGNEYVRQPRHS